ADRASHPTGRSRAGPDACPRWRGPTARRRTPRAAPPRTLPAGSPPGICAPRSQPSAPPVAEDRQVFLQDSANLLERRAARVIVELARRRRRWNHLDLGRLLLPNQQRATHVVGRADQQDAPPPVLAQDLARELHVLEGVRRPFLEHDDRGRN